ncbi:hypothetical protein CEXT_385951 [Caerostris extrusa]|uniref:Uncharacterized protein n=1 Tax=Caerostris extrusa TaxID=172846 RepID=A0AAV4XWZ1_CAEEX|nr:hypothetical protein CEXT_385951 [Caerostris extrusa]
MLEGKPSTLTETTKRWPLGHQAPKKLHIVPPGLEPGTVRVIGRCDNHYIKVDITILKLANYPIKWNNVLHLS